MEGAFLKTAHTKTKLCIGLCRERKPACEVGETRVGVGGPSWQEHERLSVFPGHATLCIGETLRFWGPLAEGTRYLMPKHIL